MKTEDPEIKIPTMLIMSVKKLLLIVLSVTLIFSLMVVLSYNEISVFPMEVHLQGQIDTLQKVLYYQYLDLTDAHDRISKLESRILELEKPTSLAVRVTNYYPVVEQCDADPDITASGAKIDIPNASQHRYIAISWDLHKNLSYRLPEDDPAYGKGMFEMGDYVEVTGAGIWDGIYQIEDTMNERHRMAIDILTTDGTDLAYAEGVTITKVFIPELHAIDA